MTRDDLGEVQPVLVGIARRAAVIWRLEVAQMMRRGSMAWAVALAALPAVLAGLIDRLEPRAFQQPGFPELALYALVPTLVCLLGLLLTATSAVHSEIENRTWIYLAVRPHTKISALAGKYLFAVSWVFGLAVAATLLTAIVVGGAVSLGTVATTLALALLACLAYGALYLLIGVAFLRVGMVAAIAYTLIVEGLLGNVPAVVNEATIGFHLRSLFLRTVPDGALPPEAIEVLGGTEGTVLGHVAIVGGMTLAFLMAAAWILTSREVSVGRAD